MEKMKEGAERHGGKDTVGSQLDAQSWKKFHARRTNSSERTGIMDDPCQSRETPKGTTTYKVTHTSREEL